LNNVDFYTGAPVEHDIQEPTTDMSTQYVFDANQRMARMQQMQPQQPMYYQPGFGYNMNIPTYPPQPQYPYYNQMPAFPMNQPVYPQPMGGGYMGPGVGNPAFAYMQQNQMNPYGYQYGAPQQMQFQYEDKVVNVPGFNTGSDVMLTADAQDICDRMQVDMMVDQEEAIAKRMSHFQGYFNYNQYGYNYYGTPYVNMYEDQSVTARYRQKISDMRQEAVQRRMKFNKNLSKLVHNYLNDGTTDDEINKVYDGYSYTIPGAKIKSDQEQARMDRLVPVSNQNAYVNHFNEVKQMMDNIVNPKGNMQDFLHDQGMFQIYINLEEELHRRRDDGRLYNKDAYKVFLRRAIRERQGLPPDPKENIPMGAAFPTLNECGRIMEDGTLSISAPSWIRSNNGSGIMNGIETKDSLEQHFEENRHRFLQSIWAQDQDSGVVKNGT
jgi:hypothetical protein